MKKVSTRALAQSKNISQPQLTIGLDLGDRNSWYCVVDEAGRVPEQEDEDSHSLPVGRPEPIWHPRDLLYEIKPQPCLQWPRSPPSFPRGGHRASIRCKHWGPNRLIFRNLPEARSVDPVQSGLEFVKDLSSSDEGGAERSIDSNHSASFIALIWAACLSSPSFLAWYMRLVSTIQ